MLVELSIPEVGPQVAGKIDSRILGRLSTKFLSMAVGICDRHTNKKRFSNKVSSM